ncbi:hypothetical protein CHLRE_12g509250v5 [Chlamydomonas reinhardtii]|uniref:Thioredoxin domain-containing protein n=1 Tax=Chlamydomonas reinhardtii TaxID=3055 RepID=A0A2K3D2N8_CHLRE|nr:uncharacterized protein CHLRE_12g509250v5 [Chlamydomonas reinhardtii]PNW74801.1 hypothetical protein CHLRE_12g509250v5 [Chlamydomonas reinhardtii]
MRAAPACVGAAAAPERQSGGRSAGRSLTAARATAKADPTPAIVNYTVQKGETLWDVAVQHGVSMRTIKELNKLSGKEPLLKEGQQLLVPASGISQLAVMEAPATTTPVLGSVPARGMWVGSEYVRLATISDARQLYLSQCDRANSQNTLLVLYAPWCPHCREMEDELERLAEGLSHEQNVRVVAVNGDSPEGRIFSREVLGVAYYPSIISFPEHSRTFYKYKGRQRDAESLLRFLNMTCCSRAREDQMWTLRPAGTRSTVAALPGASTFLPIGMSPSALAAGVGSAALALVGIAAFLRTRRPMQSDVVAELDSSVGRMLGLLLRALGTRVALVLGLGRNEEAQAAAAVVAAVPAAPAADATAASVPAAPAEADAAPVPVDAAEVAQVSAAPTALAPAAAAEAPIPVVVAEVLAPAAPAPVDAAAPAAAAPASTANGNGVGTTAATAPAAAGTAAAAAAAAVSAATAVARELTAEERMRLTRLTDDELIALVNSDPDLDKVLSRLLGDK